MLINEMVIGYFGTESGRSTLVHATDKGKSLCGYSPKKSYLFQWCANGSSGIEYVGCNKCQKILLESMDTQQKTTFKQHILKHINTRMWGARWARWFK